MSEEWRSQFPLRACGRDVVNRRGQRFKFAGVNWYGASDVHHVVAGLLVRPLEGICEVVAAMGFTVVRLPFSSEMLHTAEVPPGAIDYTLNPQLQGLSPLEVYDRVVDALGDVGVAVVVNNHTTLGVWSGGADGNGLWFREGCQTYTEDRWIGDWLEVAARYAGRPHVVGYDLRNEVRPTSLLGTMAQGPGWGTGGDMDWAVAAGDCARALASQEFAKGLIIVERTAWPQDSLEKMLMPVPPWEAWGVPRERIMLSLHMYSWSGPGAWSPKAFAGHIAGVFLHAADYVFSKALYGELEDVAFERQMDSEFGFCLDGNICPVWLSEFGADLQWECDRRWFEKMCQYLHRKDVDFAYWPLNVGPKPGGMEDEPYGLLTNDWQPRWGDARLRALRQLLPTDSPRTPLALLRRPSFFMEAGAGAAAEVCHALSPHPWCAPLPGPVVPWPDEQAPVSGVLPAARYLWVTLGGSDADPGRNASVMSGDLATLKQRCIEGGYGGFALHNDTAYMRQASPEDLLQRLEASFENTVLYIAEEVRLCAVWNVVEEELHFAVPEADQAETEGTNLESDVVESSGGEEDLIEACQRACLRRGYHGFETRLGQSSRARLLSLDAVGALQNRINQPEANSPTRRLVEEAPSLAGQLHILEHVLVRVGLEASEGRDAFQGCNARVVRGANLARCRQLCLQEGFGGFAIYRGDAYFRTAHAASLRRHLAPCPGCTFYVLVCEELQRRSAKYQVEKAGARQAMLAGMMPQLFKVCGP